MVYPALQPLMRTPRLPVVGWTDATVDLNGLVRFAERRNLVSARVPSHFKHSLLKIFGYSLCCTNCVHLFTCSSNAVLPVGVNETSIIAELTVLNFHAFVKRGKKLCENWELRDRAKSCDTDWHWEQWRDSLYIHIFCTIVIFSSIDANSALPSQTAKKVGGLLISHRSCTKERVVISCDRPQNGHFITWQTVHSSRNAGKTTLMSIFISG